MMETRCRRPLRVVLDVTPLLGPPTGIHQVTAALIKALMSRADVAPFGYVLSARASSRRLRALSASLGMHVLHCRVPASLCHWGWSRGDRPRLAKLTRRSDVIHGTNYAAPPLGVERHSRARLITVQDLGLVTQPDWCTPAVRRMGSTLRRAVAGGAHLHVTTRAAAAESVAVLGVDPERVHVVPLGVDSVGSGDPDAARRLVAAERYVLALGATEPRKNHVCLPRAVAALDDDVKLVVAGPVGLGEAALVEAVTGSRLGHRYVRLVDVDRRLRADLVHGASVLAYPSLMEGFGLPPLEAVVAGTSVAATAVGALPELLGPEIPLAEPGDDDGFIDCLATLMAELKPPPSAVQARIASLSWERAAKRFVAIYHSLASVPDMR